MISKMIKYGLFAVILAGALCASRLVPSAAAQQTASSATDALQKAHVLDRLAEAMSAEHKGTAPGFVLDPAWPQPLPHHWVIGDVGGIAVDKHDHIWVYHRPRSVTTTDSGMQGAAGKDAKGKPISALGFPRPYGQLNGCCMPAPSVLVFDKAGKLLQSWGGPGDPGFLRDEMPRAGRLRLACARAWHLRRSERLRLRRRQRPGSQFPWPVSLGAELRERFADPEIQNGRHIRLPDRHGRARRDRTATIRTAASTERPNLSGRPTWSWIRRRTSCTSPTVTATGAC